MNVIIIITIIMIIKIIIIVSRTYIGRVKVPPRMPQHDWYQKKKLYNLTFWSSYKSRKQITEAL